jgi:hypothetical protein
MESGAKYLQMIHPKYYLFIKISAIIALVVMILLWTKVPEEELLEADTPELVQLKESINEAQSDKQRP